MSQAIFKQYIRSPRSFAKMRISEMKLKKNQGIKSKFRICAHYVSSCIFSKDKDWLKNSPLRTMTIMAVPMGLMLNIYFRYKAR